MKNILLIIFAMLSTVTLFGQQLPLTDNYLVDKYSLSSAYAGNSENNDLFFSYRRDWAGIADGPRTIRLSYHNGFKNRTGIGGKLVMDKIGIFQSFFAMGTYSYRLNVSVEQFIFFGLSAGLQQNSINFGEYYNDPKYGSDPAVANRDVNSRLGLVSDFSLIYAYKGFQSGLLFSNISSGDFTYELVNTHYNPFLHFQFHGLYTIDMADNWKITPMVIFRGGKNVKNQLEAAVQLKYQDKLWASILHRGQSVYGVGFGANIGKGVLFNYNFSFFSDAVLSAFQHHELTVGIKLSELFPPKEKQLE